jgi:hypothetical protein
LVTPFPPAVSRPLIEGLRSESICANSLAVNLFPEIRPISYDAAVAQALKRSAPSLALPSLDSTRHRTIRAEGVICDIRECIIEASPDHVFALLESVGRASREFATMRWHKTSRSQGRENVCNGRFDAFFPCRLCLAILRVASVIAGVVSSCWSHTAEMPEE